MFQKALSTALIFAFVAPVFTQAVQPKPDREEIRKEAIAFLRETMGDVQNMRTLENRISFSAELAGLMWYHDEAEAKSMFNSAISDFRELVTRLDMQLNALPENLGADTSFEGTPVLDASDRRKMEMKYRVATAVRQQIATSIAEHDADVAMNFFYDTASSNQKVASWGGRDTQFELNLLKQIAGKNPAKASQHALKSLDKGLDFQHVDLLRQIYEKDQEVAIEFGAALLRKAKDTKFKAYELYTLDSLMNFGTDKLEASRKTSGKKPVYSQAEMREIAELMARSILESEIPDSGLQYISAIERYSPSRAAQVRAKFRTAASNENSNIAYRAAANSANAIYTAVNAQRSANTASGGESERQRQQQEARRAAESQLAADVAALGTGGLPKEERDKVVGHARKILMQSHGKDKQITGLSMLASQVAKAGDKQLAAEIMRDAESLVNPQLKNYQDLLYTWMLVSGYAESNPDRAFPILESAIGRANELISAFVKVGEFIDVTEEMISDGEAQVGAFGGGMIRGLSKELGVAEATIGTLIIADFAKTKALTNRFERPEVRILAKVLVLRSALGKKPVVSAEEQVKKVMGQN